MKKGFVKLYRSLIFSNFFKKPETLKVFIYILLTANFKSGEFEGKIIHRGQLVTSYRKISLETGLSISKVRTALKNLQNSETIALSPTSKFTIITIVNYAKYQDRLETKNDLLKPIAKKSSSDPSYDLEELMKIKWLLSFFLPIIIFKARFFNNVYIQTIRKRHWNN